MGGGVGAGVREGGIQGKAGGGLSELLLFSYWSYFSLYLHICSQPIRAQKAPYSFGQHG